jgi:hypothetical protein
MMTTWCGGAHFAEVAEACGVPTEHVAAVRVDENGTVVVVYGERQEAWLARAAVFSRDGDGLLVKHAVHELPSGYLETLTEGCESDDD